MIDPQPYIRVVVGVSAAGRALSSLEYLCLTRSFRNDGPLSSEMSRCRRPFRGLLKRAEFVFGWPGVLSILLTLPALSASCAYFALRGSVPVSLLGSYALVNSLFALRSGFILDGADYMCGITALACFIALAFGSEAAAAAALVFLAGQLSICYLTAGLSKITQPEWRSGNLLRASLSTSLFGRHSVYRFLSEYSYQIPLLARVLIGAELLWALAPLVPPSVAVALLASAALFHLLSGVIMGLNNFIYGMGALFPAVLYVSRSIFES